MVVVMPVGVIVPVAVRVIVVVDDCAHIFISFLP
jgi:hypothetical protein